MLHKSKDKDEGFTIVEVIVSVVVFPIMVFALISIMDAVRRSYSVARQYNEAYAVLSSCPEIDRALEFQSLSISTNCYPVNTFEAEGGSTATLTYQPTINITNTNSLDIADPLYSIPDSKVVDVGTRLLNNQGSELKLRLLITRNGVAQQ